MNVWLDSMTPAVVVGNQVCGVGSPALTKVLLLLSLQCYCVQQQVV